MPTDKKSAPSARKAPDAARPDARRALVSCVMLTDGPKARRGEIIDLEPEDVAGAIKSGTVRKAGPDDLAIAGR